MMCQCFDGPLDGLLIDIPDKDVELNKEYCTASSLMHKDNDFLMTDLLGAALPRIVFFQYKLTTFYSDVRGTRFGKLRFIGYKTETPT